MWALGIGEKREENTMINKVAQGAIALVITASVSQAGIIAEYALHDHPDGSVSDPTYGLRIDGMLGAVTTFSFDVFNDMRLVVSEDEGNISINISGTMWGGEDNGNEWINPKAYAVDFTYMVNVAQESNGWMVNGSDNVLNAGSIVELDENLNPVDGEELVTMVDADQNAFFFLADGHRIANDNSTWVGRGWIRTESTDYQPNGFQDWLFTATEVPAPGGAALLGTAALVGLRRRR